MAKRQANGAGTVHYDAKRELYIYRETRGYDENGRQIRRSVSAKTQAVLEEKVAKKRRREWKDDDHARMTVAQFSELWLEQYIAHNRLEASSAANYPFTLAHIKRHLGPLRVCDVRAHHIEEMIVGMRREGYAASTCKKARTMIGQIFRRAEAIDAIPKSPVPLADRARFVDPNASEWEAAEEVEPFTFEEVYKLLTGLPDSIIGHSIRVLLGGGLRSEELLPLESSDIADGGVGITIRRALKRKGASYIGKTKSKAGQRQMILPRSIWPSAEFLRDAGNGGFIFPGRYDGMPLSYSTYLKRYKEAIAAVEGVRPLTPHSCRHTYITMLHEINTDMGVIQRFAGQSDVETTRGYIHARQQVMQGAVEQLDTFLAPGAADRKG